LAGKRADGEDFHIVLSLLYTVHTSLKMQSPVYQWLRNPLRAVLSSQRL